MVSNMKEDTLQTIMENKVILEKYADLQKDIDDSEASYMQYVYESYCGWNKLILSLQKDELSYYVTNNAVLFEDFKAENQGKQKNIFARFVDRIIELFTSALNRLKGLWAFISRKFNELINSNNEFFEAYKKKKKAIEEGNSDSSTASTSTQNKEPIQSNAPATVIVQEPSTIEFDGRVYEDLVANAPKASYYKGLDFLQMLKSNIQPNNLEGIADKINAEVLGSVISAKVNKMDMKKFYDVIYSAYFKDEAVKNRTYKIKEQEDIVQNVDACARNAKNFFPKAIKQLESEIKKLRNVTATDPSYMQFSDTDIKHAIQISQYNLNLLNATISAYTRVSKAQVTQAKAILTLHLKEWAAAKSKHEASRILPKLRTSTINEITYDLF